MSLPQIDEATNLGAGILCAYGVGWYPSVEEAAASMTDIAGSFQPDEQARASYEQLFTEELPTVVPGRQAAAAAAGSAARPAC